MENYAPWNFGRKILKFYKAEFCSADFRGEKFYCRAMAAKIDAPVRKLN